MYMDTAIGVPEYTRDVKKHKAELQERVSTFTLEKDPAFAERLKKAALTGSEEGAAKALAQYETLRTSVAASPSDGWRFAAGVLSVLVLVLAMIIVHSPDRSSMLLLRVLVSVWAFSVVFIFGRIDIQVLQWVDSKYIKPAMMWFDLALLLAVCIWAVYSVMHIPLPRRAVADSVADRLKRGDYGD